MSATATEVSRILIVEDELIIAADLESSLQELGFDVVATAADADEAISLASHQRPDLVLMDIQLNGEPSGIRAADTIRRNWNIPVVFLTAFTSEETMQRARAAGAYGFLTKPFRVEDLNASIQIALQQHRLEQDLFAEHNWLVTMLASLSDGVVATDAGGCIRYLNPAAEDMTGWSSAEALGRPIEEVYVLKNMDGTVLKQCQLRRALETRKPIPKARFSMQIRRDGTLPVEDAASPIIEDGHLLGAVTIFLDITARLQAEEQQRKKQQELQQEVRQTTLELGQTREELRALSGRLITTQEDERRRVARELHDDLGQRAARMGWRVAELMKTAETLPEEARSEIDTLQVELNQLSASLREVSHQLHPAVIADLGLVTAIQGLIDRQRQQGTEITLVARDIPSEIQIETSTAIYRIAQEALRNAVQHAPDAPILVMLSIDNDNLTLSVEDPGPGFNLEAVRQSAGLGLMSIQERARLAGGKLEIKTAPDEGTLISVRLPLEME